MNRPVSKSNILIGDNCRFSNHFKNTPSATPVLTPTPSSGHQVHRRTDHGGAVRVQAASGRATVGCASGDAKPAGNLFELRLAWWRGVSHSTVSGTCRHLSALVDTCWYLLALVGSYRHLLALAGTCWHLLALVDSCRLYFLALFGTVAFSRFSFETGTKYFTTNLHQTRPPPPMGVTS